MRISVRVEAYWNKPNESSQWISFTEDRLVVALDNDLLNRLVKHQ